MNPVTAPDEATRTTERRAATVEAMFDRIAGRYDLVNRMMTLGRDESWRERTVAALRLRAGAVVVDVACGTGDLCRALDRSGYVAFGLDRSAGMLAMARTDAPLLRGDAFRLPFADTSVDGVVCGFGLRNFPARDPFLAACLRALRPGGRIAVLETAVPDGRFRRAGHAFWLGRVVPRLGAWLSDAPAYRYLPATTAELPEPGVLLDEFARAGFVDVDRRTYGFGGVQVLTGTRP